jgi:hypothetical protein
MSIAIEKINTNKKIKNTWKCWDVFFIDVKGKYDATLTVILMDYNSHEY